MTNIEIDLSDKAFRLVEVSAELFALEDLLSLIEKQLDHLYKTEKAVLDISLSKFESDDPDWHFLNQDFDNRNDFIYPRFFRGSFLISLYAVYESTVTEIASLIQEREGIKILLDDIKGNNFLDRAMKYYKHILKFELCSSDECWQQINKLSVIRNALAHTNGRLKMLNKKVRNELRDWSKKNTGIKLDGFFVTIDAPFATMTFKCVQSSLSDLIERYKIWDDKGHSNQ